MVLNIINVYHGRQWEIFINNWIINTGIGNLKVKSENKEIFTINDIKVCPEMKYNLFSVSQFTDNKVSLFYFFDFTSLKMMFSKMIFRTPKASLLRSAIKQRSYVTINYILPDNTTKTVNAKKGENLLELAHNNNIDLEGACECSLACSTCNYYWVNLIYNLL